MLSIKHEKLRIVKTTSHYSPQEQNISSGFLKCHYWCDANPNYANAIAKVYYKKCVHSHKWCNKWYEETICCQLLFYVVKYPSTLNNSLQCETHLVCSLVLFVHISLGLNTTSYSPESLKSVMCIRQLEKFYHLNSIRKILLISL